MKATWIWYPGDFEVWLGNKFNNRRTERGAMFPPFWKQDSHWPTVVFTKKVILTAAETIVVVAEGQYSMSVDGCFTAATPLPCRGGGGGGVIPAGEHTISIKVWNQATPPAIFIDSPTVQTDSSWRVTYEDKIWIDENGIAHGSGIYVPVGCWNFNSADTPPSQYHLERRRMLPVSSEDIGAGTLYDFGRETFGYLKVEGLKGNICIYYGESREEALDQEHCETLDRLTSLPDTDRVDSSKAFRYVYITKEAGAGYGNVSMEYEYTLFDPKKSGSFRCNDDELNRIWEVSAYTLDLTTREFFCDGIKRDRWAWSGDAIQSYLMNYYLRFDVECVKRTIRQLRGKDPVTAHINTIMDYTFYWFISIEQYYQYSGDIKFLEEIYPKMATLMEYVEKRLNEEGLAEAKADDWVFVDWTDFPMHKHGTLSFEEILLYKSLMVMFRAELMLGHGTAKAIEWIKKAKTHMTLLKEKFWNGNLCALMHSIEDGQMNAQVTRFPNTMAIVYNMFEKDKKEAILNHVLLNPSVPAITTPYMRFYELEALCMMQQQEQVLKDIKDYWGGMLREDATTFWEKYNPMEHGTEHLAMYGRPYGKSLCHAWGASPLYLLGRYFLGVRPTKPGYEAFEVHPVLGGLEWFDGDVPTPRGMIHVSMNKEEITVSSDFAGGTLIVADKEYPIIANSKNTVKL